MSASQRQPYLKLGKTYPCPHCKTVIKENEHYCTQCGANFAAPQATHQRASPRLSIQPVALIHHQTFGATLHTNYYGRLICTDEALYFIQGHEVSPWLRSWVGIPFVLWKEYRTKKELARVSHLAPERQLQEMPGSFTIALADIASYGLHINAIDLRLTNNQKLRFAVGTHRMDVELFLQRSRIPREQKS